MSVKKQENPVSVSVFSLLDWIEAFIILLDTGIRASELLALDHENVNTITGVVQILHGKGGKFRTAYLSKKSRLAVRRYITKKGIKNMGFKDLFSSVTNMNTSQLQAFIDSNREGDFTLLDVRQPAEYENARIPGSKLIPLPVLDDRLSELDPQKPVIAY